MDKRIMSRLYTVTFKWPDGSVTHYENTWLMRLRHTVGMRWDPARGYRPVAVWVHPAPPEDLQDYINFHHMLHPALQEGVYLGNKAPESVLKAFEEESSAKVLGEAANG